MKITGQCHCGNISFVAQVDEAKAMVCHCADCQIFSGAPFRAVIPVPVEQVQLSGKAKHYIKIAASGNRRAQAFCADCGTQLYATEPDEPKILNIRLGCVNERSQLRPHKQLWKQSAMPWLDDFSDAPWHVQGPNSVLG